MNSSKETIPNKWTNEDLKTLLPMTTDALKYSSSYLRDNNNIWTDKIASMTNIDVNKMNISTFPRYFLMKLFSLILTTTLYLQTDLYFYNFRITRVKIRKLKNYFWLFLVIFSISFFVISYFSEYLFFINTIRHQTQMQLYQF